jgi:hypothetical protein
VDDRYIGRTPLKNQRLKPGMHELSVKAVGYKPYRLKRNFVPAEDVVIQVELEKK